MNQISHLTAGNIAVNSIVLNNEEFRYNIKYADYDDIQLDSLQSIKIICADGSLVKLGDLVNFRIQKIMDSIRRENQQYKRNITYDYKGPFYYSKSYLAECIARMDIPEGYKVESEWQNFHFDEEEEADILMIVILAISLLFIISAGLYESYLKPAIIILIIPFAFIGTTIVFFMFNLSLDRGAYAGILLLAGLSVNNSILIVDYISKHLKIFSLDNIIDLSYQRLKAIFSTMLTTVGALIPLLFFPGQSFWKSLSWSVVGGIFFSSIMCIILVPYMFYHFQKRKANSDPNITFPKH